MRTFAPLSLVALILIFWIVNSSRHVKRVAELDEEISELTANHSSKLPSQSREIHEPLQDEIASRNPDALTQAQSSIQTLLDEANKSGTQDQFGFQLQTALQALRIAQGLTTSDFIALVDQLKFPGAVGEITKLTMARVALRTAPEALLIDPPSELWKDPDFQLRAFSKLLETKPERCRVWLEENKSELPEFIRSGCQRDLLKHDLHTDPVKALDDMTENDFRGFSYLFHIGDQEARQNLAAAAIAKIAPDSENRLTIATGLLTGAFRSEEGDHREAIQHLENFFPDDPDGKRRTVALDRSLSYVLEEPSKEGIEKILTVARSISPSAEREMIRGGVNLCL